MLPTPGKVGKTGKAVGLGIWIAISILSQLCWGGCVGTTWEPPVVLAEIRTREDTVPMGSKLWKRLNPPHPDDATASSSLRHRWEDQLRSLAEANFTDKEMLAQWGEGTYPRTAFSSCWMDVQRVLWVHFHKYGYIYLHKSTLTLILLLMSPYTFPYFEERSPRFSSTVVPRNL